MAIKYIKGRLKNRTGTAQEWASTNPILLSGEFGVESDTNKLKIGDGSTHWNDLPYFGGGGSDGRKVIASIFEPTSQTWIEIDMESVSIGSEADAYIEIS